MHFWQKLFMAGQQHNEHRNHTSCIENDYSCKSNEQLLNVLAQSTDEDTIKGIKKILISRGYNRKELIQLTQQLPVQ